MSDVLTRQVAAWPPGCDLAGCRHHYPVPLPGCICPGLRDSRGYHLTGDDPSCCAHLVDVPPWTDLDEKPWYPNDVVYERTLDIHAAETALHLIQVCGQLGWGSGEAAMDALHRVETVAKANGYPVCYTAADIRAHYPKRPAFGGGLTRRIWDRDGWTCQIRYEGICLGHRDLTIDHVIPRAAGGTDNDENLQTACRPCNVKKSDRP
jgi:hypothetical protein